MYNRANDPAHLVLLLYLKVLIIGLTTSQECNITGDFTANSTYGRNLNLILSSLASNVTAKGGFYTATVGQDPNRVYALALCRLGYDEEACFSCVNTSTQDLITKCPATKEGFSWTGDVPCLVRYSHLNIFGLLQQTPKEQLYNTGDITMNLTKFDQIWESLMDYIVRNASTSSSKYATGKTELTYFQTIYAMMQCSPDISQSDCDICLRDNVDSYIKCCHGKQGGVIRTPSCFFRWDLYPFHNASFDTISLTSPPPPPAAPAPQKSTNPKIIKDNGGISSRTVIIIVVPTIIFMTLVALTCALLRRRKPKQILVKTADETDSPEFLRFDFGTIRTATDNFSNENELGKGGFGVVYKGQLPDGQDIAVKRLSRNSEQGETEFKNEVLLVARLQHRNLVKLLGFCFEGNERLLIYEFVPNASLDHLIFDPIKCLLLDWDMRYKIIGGIARGLLYLHEDSRLRIIHRDLKASNILLDANMTPKISDFGMAKLFTMNETQGNTSRIFGTFGYMAPEYVMHGQFSVKSDVYSFGVLVLEIISGQKNSSFRNGEETGVGLLTYTWESWNNGKALNLIDPILRDGSRSEMMRCIHIGLLCVQENVAQRPTMSSVVLMLSSSSLTLTVPSKPAFYMHSVMGLDLSSSLQHNSQVSDQSKSGAVQFSVNEASITELDPR